jgi:hypothetical protein
MKSTIPTILGLTVALVAATLLFAGRAEAEKASCLDANTDNDLELSVSCDVPGGTKKSYRYVNIVKNGKLNFLDDGKETEIWAQAILVEDQGTLSAGTDAVPFGTNGGKLTIRLYGAPTAKGASAVPCKSSPANQCGAATVIWNSNSDKNNPKKVETIEPQIRATYQGPQDDYFYAYHPLPHDAHAGTGYFGNKVLAVSYGGTLQLFGKKGAIYDKVPADTSCHPTGPDSAKSTGRSWTRLAKTAPAKATTIYVETPPCGLDWANQDDIVLTTTDYLPGHSEHLKISKAPVVVKATDPDGAADPTLVGTTKIEFTPALVYHHNGERFKLDNTTHPGISNLGLLPELTSKGAETRAAVGLLSRSIRIVSAGGTTSEKDLPAEDSAACKSADPEKPEANTCYFGGHTIVRQGFKMVQVQGVEFYQLGQGARIGRYPVHFHHARKTQDKSKTRPETFVKDSSIWDSMTRWIVLHGTQDVTLQRNVGYKSIGHGFYLEDATEINNKLYGNLGVFARAAVENGQNPRKVPGILAAPNLHDTNGEDFPYRSDYDHPTVFWITNGWNDFQYNLAAGAGTCGACYWFVSAVNSTISKDMKWESYASLQSINPDRAGTTPLHVFKGNSCTSAMTSFQTITGTEACQGVSKAGTQGSFPTLPPIKNPLAGNLGDLTYYPDVHPTGGRFATRCGGVTHDPYADCSTAALQPICSSGANAKDCMVTVLDQYTSSFTWAAFNFAAIWLRPQWYLVTDSVITDAQQAGLTMVTGGGYSHSDVIQGHWALVRKSVFIGNTQEEKPTEVPDSSPKRTIPMADNPFASNGGPFNPVSKLFCEQAADTNRPGNYCLSIHEGVSFQLSSFAMYQRLFSVYDGPAFQDSNAYLRIKTRVFDDCKPQARDGGASICDPPDKTRSRGSAWWAGFGVNGIPRGVPDEADPSKDFCFMPNAAIGWKQPNGFYYPPAFHSTKLFFHDVDTRHFVITPLFNEGTLDLNTKQTGHDYCSWNSTIFKGFTSIDRQTVLNDDDGTLTGYSKTIAVNQDHFFGAPVEAIQCASENTSKTSPYDYVSTVVYPRCATLPESDSNRCALDPGTNPDKTPKPNPHKGDWDLACSNEHCWGIPLHRLDLTKSDGATPKVIRMMGQSTGQRSNLTVNHGTYYLDTTVSRTKQLTDTTGGSPVPCAVPTIHPHQCNINVFREGQTYYVFLIYAKADTQQTYRFYVGPGLTDNPASELQIKLVQADIGPNPIVFTDAAGSTPAVTWVDKTRGIVEVVLKAADLTDFAGKLTAAKAKSCQPASFCTWQSNSCKACLEQNADGTCKTVGGDEVCKWAVADPHCPDGGCVGFRFTMPTGFVASDHPTVAELLTAAVPLTKNFLCSDTNFNKPFVKVSDGVCPAEGPSPNVDNRLELDFTDVVRTDGAGGSCLGVPYTAAFPFPHCKCP